MDELLRQSLLFDFYGELLTKHQREAYEAVVQNDLSYSEAAQQFGVSRQSVHELVKRSTQILEQYEQKLHLVERFLKIRSQVEQIKDISANAKSKESEEFSEQILELADEILEEL